MAEDRLGADEAETIVDVEVAARRRKERLGQRDLGVVFAQMRLHVAIRKFARQRAGGGEFSVARGDGEARRDRIVEPPLAVPALDQRLALVKTLFGRIGEFERRVAVHHHLARDHARAALFAGGEECLGRLRLYRAIDDRRRRSIAEQLVEKELRHRRRRAQDRRIFAPRQRCICAANRAVARRRSR